MENMKIAFIGRGNLKTNASTLRALRLGNLLSEKSYEIHLYLPEDDFNRSVANEIKNKGIIFHFCGDGFTEFFIKLFILSRNEFDYVHVLNVGVNSFLVGYFYKIIKRKSKIITDIDEKIELLQKSFLRKIFLKYLERFAVKKSDIVLVASLYYFEILKNVRDKEIYYFPYAIDQSNFSIGSNYKLGTSAKTKYLVYLGTFQNYNELLLIINAAEKLKKSKDYFQFLLIGDGPNKNQLEKLVINRKINNITFLGYLPDNNVKIIFQKASVFLFPIYNNEINRYRCPNKIFEYLKFRKPIVTNCVGEVSNILEDDAHYFIENSLQDFIEKILEAINSPKIPSKERIELNLWSNRAKMYIKIISEVQYS